uniref:DUF6538 domain-containing protein n=1 Tax=Roseibium sp. TaxID=1936156 RepID=UPI003A980552
MANHLLLKDGRYFFRRRIPVQLQARLGKSDIVLALPFCSKRQATALALCLTVEFERFCEPSEDVMFHDRARLQGALRALLDQGRPSVRAPLQMHVQSAAACFEVVNKDGSTEPTQIVSLPGAVERFIQDHLQRGLWRPDAECEARNSLSVFMEYVGDADLRLTTRASVAGLTCHVIFPPLSIRVRPNLRTDNEANK